MLYSIKEWFQTMITSICIWIVHKINRRKDHDLSLVLSKLADLYKVEWQSVVGQDGIVTKIYPGKKGCVIIHQNKLYVTDTRGHIIFIK